MDNAVHLSLTEFEQFCVAPEFSNLILFKFDKFWEDDDKIKYDIYKYYIYNYCYYLLVRIMCFFVGKVMLSNYNTVVC